MEHLAEAALAVAQRVGAVGDGIREPGVCLAERHGLTVAEPGSEGADQQRQGQRGAAAEQELVAGEAGGIRAPDQQIGLRLVEGGQAVANLRHEDGARAQAHVLDQPLIVAREGEASDRGEYRQPLIDQRRERIEPSGLRRVVHGQRMQARFGGGDDGSGSVEVRDQDGIVRQQIGANRCLGVQQGPEQVFVGAACLQRMCHPGIGLAAAAGQGDDRSEASDQQGEAAGVQHPQEPLARTVDLVGRGVVVRRPGQIGIQRGSLCGSLVCQAVSPGWAGRWPEVLICLVEARICAGLGTLSPLGCIYYAKC